MNYCETIAAQEGFDGVQLDTAIPAKHLVEWYLKRGYKIVGQEHYEGKTYDSYVFEKALNDRENLNFLEDKSR
jgi:cytolysin (calcineurin-like family phosphatase)